jgi:hypothetical protein
MDEVKRLRMRRAHATHGHLCICGRYVRGNGGQWSHRQACKKLARYRAFRDCGDTLTGLPVVAEFVWAGRTDLSWHPGEAAYELARTAPDLIVWQPHDLDRGQGYRVGRLPETLAEAAAAATAGAPRPEAHPDRLVEETR